MTITRAGAARAPITPASGGKMAGYVRREGPAEGVADELWCRALVLDDGERSLAVVALDLLYATAALTARVRARIADRLAIPEADVMVVATHTHCGPGPLAGERDPGLLDAIADASCSAVAAAAAELRPARLAVGGVEIPGIGRNRRDGRTRHDERAHVVAILPDGDGEHAIATLVAYACHPTILEHDTRLFSAEYPGAARSVVEQLCGGLCLFVQGCAADVNPLFTAHTPAECRRVGGIVGAAAAGLALRLRALGRPQRVVNLNQERELPVPESGVAGRLVDPAALRAVACTVPAQRRAHPEPAAVRRELEALRAGGDASGRAAELWAEELLLAGADPLGDVDLPVADTTPIELQAFRLGERLVLLGLPGEPFAATGLALSEGSSGDLIVAGYANASAGYLPPDDEFDRGGYEVGISLYARGTAERLAAAAEQLVAELMAP